MFLMLFRLSKTGCDLHKAFLFYTIVNYQLKTRELKNVEKLVEETVQALKFY